MPVRVLTVNQPVASAMVTPDERLWASGSELGGFVPVKPVENRSWAPSSDPDAGPWQRGGEVPHAGILVAVHAGRAWWPRPGGKKSSGARPDPKMLAWVRERWPEMPEPGDLPLRAVVGCVRVRAFFRIADLAGSAQVDMGLGGEPEERRRWRQVVQGSPWLLGPVAWYVDRAWRLREPVPHLPGTLGLSAAPEAVERACLDAGARPAGSSR